MTFRLLRARDLFAAADPAELFQLADPFRSRDERVRVSGC